MKNRQMDRPWNKTRYSIDRGFLLERFRVIFFPLYVNPAPQKTPLKISPHNQQKLLIKNLLHLLTLFDPTLLRMPQLSFAPFRKRSNSVLRTLQPFPALVPLILPIWRYFV
jgi:hypothetical protein